MFQNSKEQNTFMTIVDGRAPVATLFETAGVVADIKKAVTGCSDTHTPDNKRYKRVNRYCAAQ